MRKVVLSMFVTLDGFISGPNGELDWMPGSEEHPDEEVDRYMFDMLDEVDTMLLGARTYELFVAYWPTATTKEQIVADKLNAMSKVVFSSAREVHWGKWGNTRLAQAPPRQEIGRLHQQPGRDMVIFGGAALSQSFMELGLIDEIRLFVAPIILGRGKPLFRPIANRVALRRVGTKTFGSGTVLLSYVPQGRGVG
jgi:dihydrofolate reductase